MPPPTTERRRSPRRKPSQLVYLEFGRENGGMVKDVSEDGMRFYVINPVTVGQTLHFVVNLDAKRRIEGEALMVWADASRKTGGMSFAQISAECRESLRAWLAESDSPLPASAVIPDRPAAAPSIPAASPPVPPPTLSVVPVPVAAAPEPNVSTPTALAPFVSAPIAAIPAPHVPTPVALSPVASAPAASTTVASKAPDTIPTEIPAHVSPRVLAPAPVFAKTSLGIPAATAEDERPVTREDWIRAARENPVPGERTGKPAETSRREPIAAISMGERLLPRSPVPAPEIETPDTRKFEKVAERVDPLREFLKYPFEECASAQPPDETRKLAEEDAPAVLDEPVSGGWSVSRVAMVLALAGICGIAATFAAVAYRRTVGESIIELGEKISGEPRSSAAGDADRPPAEQSPSADPQAPSPDSTKPAIRRPAVPEDNSSSTSPRSTPSSNTPATPSKHDSVWIPNIPSPSRADPAIAHAANCARRRP